MTRKIHPLDSVRLTLNCEAGTLSLDVNGADQGVVFSNVPPEVHPAVCFYGSAKSVRLVELKRIYSESDGDTSDSEDESDEEGATCRGGEEKEAAPLSQRPSQQQQQQQREEQPHSPVVADENSNNSNQVAVPANPAVEPRGNAVDRNNAAKLAQGSHGNLRLRKSARREEEAASSFIRAASASSPSRGLLASLANLAQWYVPQGEEDTERDEHGATEQRSDVGAGEGDRMNRLSETVDDSAHAVSRLMAGKCPTVIGLPLSIIGCCRLVLACASKPSQLSYFLLLHCSTETYASRLPTKPRVLFRLYGVRPLCLIPFLSFPATPASTDGGGGIAGSGESLDFEARRYFRCESSLDAGKYSL